MKKLITYIFILFCVSSFAQKNKERSFYFDTYKLVDVKYYAYNMFAKSHIFTNSKDDSYLMELRYEANKKTAYLKYKEGKKHKHISFDLDFEYKVPNDLNKLKNSKLYSTVIPAEQKKHKNAITELVYEKDSLTDETIVRATRFENKKKKKIIDKQYYFFSKSNSLIELKPNYTSDYDLHFLEDASLDKIISVNSNNEKTSEATYLEYKKIDFLFKFKIDELSPTKNIKPLAKW